MQALLDAVATYCNRHTQEMANQYPGSKYNVVWSYEVAKTYIKIVRSDKSVHAFVQIADDGRWKSGDIFKPASWRGPTKNFSRGNVLKNNYSILIYGI